jgi:hypothetical protein
MAGNTAFIEEFKSVDDRVKQFESEQVRQDLDGANILIAWYGYGSYCGDSLVLYEKDGTLYENNASHCSCFGIEGQWQPERTNWPVLSQRTLDNDCNGGGLANAYLQRLVRKHLVGADLALPPATKQLTEAN